LTQTQWGFQVRERKDVYQLPPGDQTLDWYAAASEKGLLQADAGVFDAGDDAIGMNADKGDDGRAPASDLGFRGAS
jgi:hypothetical protein